MTSKNEQKRETGSAVQSSDEAKTTAASNDSNNDEISYKLGHWISKIFKIDIAKANKISKSIIGATGAIVSIITVVVTIIEAIQVK